MRMIIFFSYDGSNYFGFQKQNNKRTVQQTLEEALMKINKATVRVIPSGRTDTGVHACNQVAHFDLDINITKAELKKALNALLPGDIYVKRVAQKANFHARFDATKKAYVYVINMGTYNVFEKDYVMQLNQKLAIEKMQAASKHFLGTHDFSSFCKKSSDEDCRRTIWTINFTSSGNKLKITIVGSGFLRYMVRNMVGTLIEVGLEKIAPEKVEAILASKDRRVAGVKAPANGLYLQKVYYQ